MDCPVCEEMMIRTQATDHGEKYWYCRQCKKELSELVGEGDFEVYTPPFSIDDYEFSSDDYELELDFDDYDDDDSGCNSKVGFPTPGQVMSSISDARYLDGVNARIKKDTPPEDQW